MENEQHYLHKLFEPESIAIVGASEKPNSIGVTLVRNMLDTGYKGSLFFVNPKHETVFGGKSYPSVDAIPHRLDIAVICTRANSVPDIIDACGRAGCRNAIIISGGFAEAGPRGSALQRAALENARRHGMRVIGPNCLGIMRPGSQINLTFAHGFAHPGTVGLISHGSDLRNPARHAAAFRYSPFADPADRTTTILQARAEANAKILSTFEGPVFVSTPDLLDDAPHAQWCPGVVDPDWWASDWPVMAREVPVVVHIPSNGRLKGSEHIDPVMRELEAAGRIRYHRPEGIDREGLRRAYQEADIVVDQLVMGLYGVAAVEAMAAGRVVVAFVGNTVRDRIRTATGLEVPIVEADPDTLKAVIERLLDDRDLSLIHI